MEYKVGVINRGKGVCLLGQIEGIKNSYELSQGLSRKKDWPDDARFTMSKNFPKDIKLEDRLRNNTSLLVVSDAFKKLVESENAPALEYLPVSIMNHKGRKEKAQYWVLHSTPLVDCIDLNKTKFDRNQINPKVFSDVQNLTLDPKRIGPDLKLFRTLEFWTLPIFRSDLVKKIQDAGMTGIDFIKPEEWSLGM